MKTTMKNIKNNEKCRKNNEQKQWAIMKNMKNTEKYGTTLKT